MIKFLIANYYGVAIILSSLMKRFFLDTLRILLLLLLRYTLSIKRTKARLD